MERAHQACGPQSALAHARVRVSTDVVEREHPVTRVTDDDFAAFQDSSLHSSLWNLGQGHHGHEGFCHLQLDLSLENRHRLAADPDGIHTAVAQFQLHLDPAGSVYRMPLDATERGALLTSGE